MPLPQKKRRRSRTPRGGFSRQRRGEDGASVVELPDSSNTTSGEDGASLSGSLVELPDSSSTTSGEDGASFSGFLDEPSNTRTPYESRYENLLASRLARLKLPAGTDDDSDLVDRPNLPSDEILEALSCSSFYDDDLRDALVEYQVQKYLSDTPGGIDSGESDSADVAMVDSVESGDDDIITEEQSIRDSEMLRARRTEPIDDYTKLDIEQMHKLDLKHALYRIKACLLLKGKPIDDIDDAALASKYPEELISQNGYFLDYLNHDTFGWFFDSELCRAANLTDYQRLVLFNYGGDEYENWRLYRTYYNTPQTDREYLLYWETIAKKIKWIEHYVCLDRASDEWWNMKSKGLNQAIRIATGFPNIHLQLACHGFQEYINSTYCDVLLTKDLDGVFFEIWKRVIREQKCFRDALKELYDLKMFPSQEHNMKCELKYSSFGMEQDFHRCTAGIIKEVPDYRARELIAQEVRYRCVLTRRYEQYARKKLKVAEYIGLISKQTT